jgi:amidophosphoribosyltransferase
MAKMGDFIAFQAIVALLKRDGKEGILDLVYMKCKEQEAVPKEQVRNYVKEVYEAYTQEEISEMVAKLVTPEGTKAKVSVLFQTIEGLHNACPNNQGDWYFSGNYPTPGGNKVVNKAFINYMEGRTERAY